VRYRVGCAGQFFMNDDSGGASPIHNATDDVDEAIASCETGPVGCEVYDTVEDRWIGPTCMEEIEAAKTRLAQAEVLAEILYERDADHYVRVGWAEENEGLKREYRRDAREIVQRMQEEVSTY